MAYSINKIAKMTGITLRTLRHYDQIGLFQPSGRSESGYRLYSNRDLETLQQILFFRELDFPLSKISELIKSPGFDRQTALEMQKTFLEQRARRYQGLAQLAQDTLTSMKGDTTMKEEELFTGFDYDQTMLEQKTIRGRSQDPLGRSGFLQDQQKADFTILKRRLDADFQRTGNKHAGISSLLCRKSTL